MSKGTFILSGHVYLWWAAEVILCDCLSSEVQTESWTLKTEWLPLSLKLFAFVWNGRAEFDGDAQGIASLPFPCRGLSWLKDWVIFRPENDQTVKLWAWQVNPLCFMIHRWLSNPSLYLLYPLPGVEKVPQSQFALRYLSWDPLVCPPPLSSWQWHVSRWYRRATGRRRRI